MRLILFVLATLVASSPVLAQGWEEYAYPEYVFAVDFPATPQVENTAYEVVPGRSVPARVYSVRQEDVIFKMTVADLAGANLEESAIIDHAIKVVSEGGTVGINIPARIYRVYGRQLTVQGMDGSQSMLQLFDYKGRLYLIEGKALPGRSANDPGFDVVRFHQSLNFTDSGTNRSEDAIRAIREVCRGLPNPAFGAGLDDPACIAP
jgi:hypothetical protein